MLKAFRRWASTDDDPDDEETKRDGANRESTESEIVLSTTSALLCAEARGVVASTARRARAGRAGNMIGMMNT